MSEFFFFAAYSSKVIGYVAVEAVFSPIDDERSLLPGAP